MSTEYHAEQAAQAMRSLDYHLAVLGVSTAPLDGLYRTVMALAAKARVQQTPREQELRDKVAAAQASLEHALMEQAKAQELAKAERARAEALAELVRQAKARTTTTTAQDAQEARAAWDEARTDAHYP